MKRYQTGVIDANGKHLANWLGDGALPIPAGQALAGSWRRKPSALAGITTRQVVVADLEDGGVVIRQTTPALERASFILNFLSPRNLTNLNAPVDAWAVEVIEEGHIDSIFSWPTNPYTQGVFTACHCPTQTRTPSL